MRSGLAVVGAAVALTCLTASPGTAQKPEEFMRPCKRADLIGVWRVMRLNVPGGSNVDRTDPAFLQHQRYVFHSNATMAYATQDVPFTAEEQGALTKAPTSATWAIEADGWLVRQRDGVTAVERADCRVLTRAVTGSGTTYFTAQPGDLLLTDESTDRHPSTRRLLRKVRGLE